jgi:hypothetical protein
MWERIDEAAWPATDRAAQPEIGAFFQPAGQLRWQWGRNRHSDRFSTAEWCRRNDRMGRLIRHASWRVTLAVGTLPVAMIEPALRTPLVAAVGSTVLSPPGFTAAHRAAIALSAITVLTDPEHRMTSTAAANPLPQNHFARKRHVHPRRGLDNGSQSWQVKTSLLRGDLFEGCQAGTLPVQTAGPNLPPSRRSYTFSQRGVMIGQMTGALGADDVVCLGPCSENYVFR